MGNPVQLPIAHGFYQSDSLPLSAQECVNLYPTMPDAPALSQEAVFSTPGIEQVVTSGGAVGGRGALVMAGEPYFVTDDTLYRLEGDYTLTDLGTIAGSGRVSMATNGTQLMILVPGGAGYIYTVSGGLGAITDDDFDASGNPLYVVFIDSYFVCSTDEKKFIISAPNDGTDWDALDFGSAEASPDAVVAPFVYLNQLFIGGETTAEGFTNIGGADFPFQRSGLFLEKGIIAPFSVVKGESAVLWVGRGDKEGPAVWALAGNQTVKVSTQAIDAVLERLTETELADIFAWSYSQLGHYFCGFALPRTCFVYDFTTKLWHERKSQVTLVDSTVETQRWRINSLVQAYGEILVGDSIDGRIGRVDVDVYQEYTGVVQRVLATMPFHNKAKPFSVPSLEMILESGVGNTNAPDPVIEMSRSQDGGKTFSDPRQRRMGAQGEYKTRVIWRRLNRTARFDVYRFSVSDPVKVALLMLMADMKGAA